MTDDYLTYDRLIAKIARGYNSRLNLAGVQRELFRGFYTRPCLAYCNQSAMVITVAPDNTYNIQFPVLSACSHNVEVCIKENGRTYAVSCSDSIDLSYLYSKKKYPVADRDRYVYDKRLWGCYVFYPNRNVFKLVIKDIYGSYVYALKQHDFLNAAFALVDFELERTALIRSSAPLCLVRQPH